MATSPIDSEMLNKSVVTSPIDLENSNWSKEKGSQNGSQSDMFDSSLVLLSFLKILNE